MTIYGLPTTLTANIHARNEKFEAWVLADQTVGECKTRHKTVGSGNASTELKFFQMPTSHMLVTNDILAKNVSVQGAGGLLVVSSRRSKAG
jgi:hypothetical protein